MQPETPANAGDLTDILGAIREVRENLDRREARAAGATWIAWGVAVASIFLFYWAVILNPRPYADALGPLLPWVWLLPAAVAYLATVVVGARLGRLGAGDEASRRENWKRLAAGLVPSVLIAALLIIGRPDLIAAVAVAWSSLTAVLWGRWGPPVQQRAAVSLTVVGLALAAAMLVLPQPVAYPIAAAYTGLGLVGFGTLVYRGGR